MKERIDETTLRRILQEAMPGRETHLQSIHFPRGGYIKTAAHVIFDDTSESIIIAAGSRPRHARDFARAALVTRLYEQHAIPAPAILVAPAQLPGTPIHYYIQRFQPGAPSPFPNHAQLHEIGRYMARIHRIPLTDAERETITPPLTTHRSLDYQRLADLGLPRGLTHGDIFPMNLLFDPASGQLTSFIDLDEAEYVALLKDIAKATYGFCARADDFTLDLGALHAMLEGYQTIRPLSVLERNHFPEILASFAERLPGRYLAWTNRPDLFDDPYETPFIRSVPQRTAQFLRQLPTLSAQQLLP